MRGSRRTTVNDPSVDVGAVPKIVLASPDSSRSEFTEGSELSVSSSSLLAQCAKETEPTITIQSALVIARKREF